MNNQKEKVDMILEPLQVMIQLSLISHCPTGTKVSVSDNLLHIQQPSWIQGMVRWYQNDNKDKSVSATHLAAVPKDVITVNLRLAVDFPVWLYDTKKIRSNFSYSCNPFPNISVMI